MNLKEIALRRCSYRLVYGDSRDLNAGGKFFRGRDIVRIELDAPDFVSASMLASFRILRVLAANIELNMRVDEACILQAKGLYHIAVLFHLPLVAYVVMRRSVRPMVVRRQVHPSTLSLV